MMGKKLSNRYPRPQPAHFVVAKVEPCRSTTQARRRASPSSATWFVMMASFFLAQPGFAQGTGPTPELANRQLANPAQEAEATRLMHSLRCIQCQGQSIGDSDAPMAQTMRAEVRQQIAAGRKPEVIRQWMTERYGDWVSFEPEMKGAGLLLWLAPLLLLLVAILLARGLFKRRT